MIDVVAIGELLIDFTCQSLDELGYPTMAAHPGGAPANFLATLSKYGIETALIAKVGDDSFGRMLVETVKNADIDTRGIILDPAVFTTLAFVTLDKNGEREFSFARKPGADTQLLFHEIRLGLIDEAKVLHFGTLSLTNEPSRQVTRNAVFYAKEHGKLITFDPNLRKPLWADLEDAREQILWGLLQADVVKISDDEAQFLFGPDIQEAADKITSKYGVKLVFITLGKDGCFYKNAQAEGYVKNPEYDFCSVDKTGAGDIFGGAVISRILHAGKEPSHLSDKELIGFCTFACAVASLSTEHYGGIPSIPEENTAKKLMPADC